MFQSIVLEFINSKGLNQNEIAEKLGISQQSVSDFLNRTTKVRASTKKKYFDSIEGLEEFYKHKQSSSQDKDNNDAFANNSYLDEYKKYSSDGEILKRFFGIDLHAFKLQLDRIEKQNLDLLDRFERVLLVNDLEKGRESAKKQIKNN